MYDVFISYSMRGSTEPDWIMKFRAQLQNFYKNDSGRPLTVWDMSENGPGTDFAAVIDTVLDKTLVLIMVLDPMYPKSPQTLDEIRKYKEKRKNAGEKSIIIKVIKKNGGETDELINLVSSNILAAAFSKTDANGIEVEFPVDSAEYQYEIARIVKELRKYTAENRNKKNAAVIRQSLDEAKGLEKIYIAFGDNKLEKTRANLINQLGDTLRHHPNKMLQKTRLLPDDFTIPGDDFFYEDIGRLLFVQNDYTEKCIADMLDVCGTVIIPLETDNMKNGEDMLRRMLLQIDSIMKKAKNEALRVFILLNIPDALYDLAYFKEMLLNPAYSTYGNIKVFIKPDITTFINEIITPLNEKHPPVKVKAPENANKKKIYFIEYNKSDTVSLTAEQLQKERENIDETVGFIADGFGVLTNTADTPGATVDDAFIQLKRYLSDSEGIVIYRGIRGDLPWMVQQQSLTYQILQALQKDYMQRAVFVDPLQPYKSKGAYIRFEYKALLNNDPGSKQFSELNEFLFSCKSQ